MQTTTYFAKYHYWVRALPVQDLLIPLWDPDRLARKHCRFHQHVGIQI
jgi:hypothetical protein